MDSEFTSKGTRRLRKPGAGRKPIATDASGNTVPLKRYAFALLEDQRDKLRDYAKSKGLSGVSAALRDIIDNRL